MVVTEVGCSYDVVSMTNSYERASAGGGGVSGRRRTFLICANKLARQIVRCPSSSEGAQSVPVVV